MRLLKKLLTVVLLIFITTQFSQASDFSNPSHAFEYLQRDLWIQGLPSADFESDHELNKKISDISELSATDFYPEELTKVLNRI